MFFGILCVWFVKVYSLRPGRTAHGMYGFLPTQNTGHNLVKLCDNYDSGLRHPGPGVKNKRIQRPGTKNYLRTI